MDYAYSLRMAGTAVTAAKTLAQIKTGAGPVKICEVCARQITKTSTELWELQVIQYTAAPTFGTVTSTTPNPADPKGPAALAVGSTSATGVNASAEPSGGTSVIWPEWDWNVVNGMFIYPFLQEIRVGIAQGGLGGTFKLNTAPAASSTLACYVAFLEAQ